MSRIDEIQKELEEFKERQKNKEEAMQEAARKAEEARKLAEKEAQRATEAYCKAEEARKLAEETAKAIEEVKTYEDNKVDAPEENNFNYEEKQENDKKTTEVSEEKEKNSKNGNVKIKYFAIGALVTILAIGGCRLVKEAKGGKLIKPTKTPTNSNITTPISIPTSTPLAEQNITDKEFVSLVNRVTEDLNNRGIKLTQDEIVSYVMIVNIEKIARENPELIKTVIGNKDPNVVLQDAYMVMGARVTYNYEMYSETNDSSKFLDPTLVVYSANQKDKTKTIIDLVKEISTIEDNEKFNEAVVNLLDKIYDPKDKLYDLDAGTIFLLQEVLVPVRGLYGTVLNPDDRFNERGLNAIKYLVPYATDSEEYINNGLSAGGIRDINALLKECALSKEASLVSPKVRQRTLEYNYETNEIII